MLNRRKYNGDGHAWNSMLDMDQFEEAGGGGSYFWKGGSRKGGFGRTPEPPWLRACNQRETFQKRNNLPLWSRWYLLSSPLHGLFHLVCFFLCPSMATILLYSWYTIAVSVVLRPSPIFCPYLGLLNILYIKTKRL